MTGQSVSWPRPAERIVMVNRARHVSPSLSSRGQGAWRLGHSGDLTLTEGYGLSYVPQTW